MTPTDTLLHTITHGASSDDEVELRVVRLLYRAPRAAVAVTVLGQAMKFRFAVMTPRGRGLRALVEDGEGRSYRVNLDAVEFEAGSRDALVVEAYRAWLGYDAADEGTSSREVPDARLEGRAAKLRQDLARARTVFEELDFEEIAQWIGDDDPYGSHRKYWSAGAEVYEETVRRLEKVPLAIEKLSAAGGTTQAIALLEDLFDVLGVARFEDFVPSQLSTPVSAALRAWLKVAPIQLDDDAVIQRFSAWVDEFELDYWITNLLGEAPDTLEPAILRWLEARVLSGDDRHHTLTSHLCKLRLRRGELDLLLAHLSPGQLKAGNVVAVVDALLARDELQRALDLTTEWLAQAEPLYLKPPVEQARRAILIRQGRAEEALAELWTTFDARPSSERFGELTRIGDEALLLRAADRVKDDPPLLLSIAAECDPHPRIAEHLARIDVATLKRSSSRVLEPAARRLDGAFPEAALAVYTALGWRHVDRGKAQYYHLALEAFERAQDLHYELGRISAWQEVAADVAAQHGRKSFMTGFRRLMARPAPTLGSLKEE